MSSHGWTKVLLLLAAALLLRCDETLPEYNDPQNLFRPSLEAHFIYGPWEGVLDSTVKIYFNVANIFDETFDAKVNVEGFVEIILVKDTAYHKTFRLTENEIFSATNYDRLTKKLTIDPGDSLRLRVAWNLIDDYGRNLRADIFRYAFDPTCFGRGFAPPEFFIIRGQMKLFDQTGYLFPADITYQLCHVTGWGNTCPRFPLDSGCYYYWQNIAR